MFPRLWPLASPAHLCPHLRSSLQIRCVLVYDCLHGSAPRYLQEVIQPVAEVTSRRRLRSSSSSALLVPVTRCTTLGDRAFAVAGPRAWNTLPDFITDCSSLRSFKQSLKTYLFSLSFWAHNNTLFYDCAQRPSSSLCRLRRFKIIVSFPLHYITLYACYLTRLYETLCTKCQTPLTDTGYGHVVQQHQRTSSQQFYNLLYNKFATSQCQSPTSRHVKMLGCGQFLSVGDGEFVVQQVVELLWARPLVVLYMSVAVVRVVEFGTNDFSHTCNMVQYATQSIKSCANISLGGRSDLRSNHDANVFTGRQR